MVAVMWLVFGRDGAGGVAWAGWELGRSGDGRGGTGLEAVVEAEEGVEPRVPGE